MCSVQWYYVAIHRCVYNIGMGVSVAQGRVQRGAQGA